MSKIKSFVWKAGACAVIYILGWLSENIGLLQLSEKVQMIVVIVLGIILGQFSEWWNKKQMALGRGFFGGVRK